MAFFISLESSSNIMFKMGSHCSFGHLKHKLWPKEGPGIDPIYLAVDNMPNTVGKLLMKATSFF